MAESLVAQGRVLAVHTDGAVTVECATACPGCRCGRLSTGAHERRRLPVAGLDSSAVGATIVIAAPAAELLRVSLWIYGLPWLALLGGTLLGAWLGQGDTGPSAGAAVGLAAGVVAVRLLGRRVTPPRLEARSAR